MDQESKSELGLNARQQFEVKAFFNERLLVWLLGAGTLITAVASVASYFSSKAALPVTLNTVEQNAKDAARNANAAAEKIETFFSPSGEFAGIQSSVSNHAAAIASLQSEGGDLTKLVGDLIPDDFTDWPAFIVCKREHNATIAWTVFQLEDLPSPSAQEVRYRSGIGLVNFNKSSRTVVNVSGNHAAELTECKTGDTTIDYLVDNGRAFGFVSFK